MRRADQITERILSVWGKRPAAKTCNLIIRFVVDQPEQMSQMITFTDLSKISGLPPTSTALMEAVSILSSSFDVLSWRFVYFRDERSEPYYLSEEESRDFIQNNRVYDHESGEVVDSPGAKLMPYFEARKDQLCAEVA